MPLPHAEAGYWFYYPADAALSPAKLTLLTLLTLCKADLLLSPSLTVPSVMLASECNPARGAGAAVPAITGRVGGGWGWGWGGECVKTGLVPAASATYITDP